MNLTLINFFLALVNAVMAWDSYQRGQRIYMWISLLVALFCFSSACMGLNA